MTREEFGKMSFKKDMRFRSKLTVNRGGEDSICEGRVRMVDFESGLINIVPEGCGEDYTPDLWWFFCEDLECMSHD